MVRKTRGSVKRGSGRRGQGSVKSVGSGKGQYQPAPVSALKREEGAASSPAKSVASTVVVSPK